jgi:40S ribosomal protein S4 C-terminus
LSLDLSLSPVNIERHLGSFDMHVKDAHGHSFTTRLNSVFIVGKSGKPCMSLPRDKGIVEERDRRLFAKAATAPV